VVETRPWRLEGCSKERDVEKQRQDESEIGYKTATGDSLAEFKGERRVYQVARKRCLPATERS
jgi:hypothetical protein